MPQVLIVEDDQRLAELTVEFLGANGLDASIHPSGEGAVDRILADPPDVLVLDLMLPVRDGLSICRQVRNAYAGKILMLTARGDEMDQVAGLELGADDYVAKPVHPRLLLARIRALLRRDLPPDQEPASIEINGLRIDRGTRSLEVAGVAVECSTAEFDLLWLLASRAGEVLSRQEIFEALRGIDYDGLDRSVDMRVSKLRQKLGDDPRSPRLLKTVRGAGYLFTRES